jgi:hypothetical protein
MYLFIKYAPKMLSIVSKKIVDGNVGVWNGLP